MKPQFSLNYILGLIVFLSQFTPVLAEQRASLTTSSKVEEYVSETTENICKNAFQHYIGTQVIKNDSNEPFYLRGSAEETNNLSLDFTILNLKSGHLSDSAILNLSKKILSENVDVIYIQEVVSNAAANVLYEALEAHYAHFLYVPTAALNPSESGMLIASKYKIEKPQFNTFVEEGRDGSEGFLDFILKNSGTSLGHVYAINLKKDPLDQTVTYKFNQIMQKMQDDLLQVEKKPSPFILCGDFNILEGSQEWIVDLCFGQQKTNSGKSCTLLLQSLPYLAKNIDAGSSIFTASMSDGLYTLVKQKHTRSSEHTSNFILGPHQLPTAQKVKSFLKNEFNLLPVRSTRDRDEDRKTGGSVKAGITYEYGGEDGNKFKGYFKAEAHDNKGNHIEGSIDHDFNSGEGTIDFNSSHDTERSQ